MKYTRYNNVIRGKNKYPENNNYFFNEIGELLLLLKLKAEELTMEELIKLLDDIDEIYAMPKGDAYLRLSEVHKLLSPQM